MPRLRSSAKFSPTTTNDAVTSPDVAAVDVPPYRCHQIRARLERAVRSFAGGMLARTSKLATQLTRSALRFLGRALRLWRHELGRVRLLGIRAARLAMLGIRVPRTADAQYDAGIASSVGMRPGDLVFFQTYAAVLRTSASISGTTGSCTRVRATA